MTVILFNHEGHNLFPAVRDPPSFANDVEIVYGDFMDDVAVLKAIEDIEAVFHYP